MLTSTPAPSFPSFWPALAAQLPPVGEGRHVVLFDLHHFRIKVGEPDSSRALLTFALTARRVAGDPLVDLPPAVREVLLGSRVVFAEDRATRVVSALRVEGARVVELGAEFKALGANALRVKRLSKPLRVQARSFASVLAVVTLLTAVVWKIPPESTAPGSSGLLELVKFALLVIVVALLGATLEALNSHARRRVEYGDLERRIAAMGTQC